MANDMMMAFAKEILGNADHLEDKLNFLRLPATKEYFYAYLKCFICGMSCQKVQKIFDRGDCTAEDISEMMLKDLGERMAGTGMSEEEARQLQEEAGNLRLRLTEIEKNQNMLKETLETREREKSNLDISIEARERVQKQMKEKIEFLNQCIVKLEKENASLRKREPAFEKEKGTDPAVFTAEGGKAGKRKSWRDELKSLLRKEESRKKSRTEDGNRFMKDELAKESFRTEVLLNTKFSKEQKDYLFSLLESGESYVNIRPFASPGVSVEDMKRYYHLCTRGRK